MTISLKEMMELDLEFLQKAFPCLQEEFPGFCWVVNESHVADYCIAFQNVIFTSLESVHVRRKRDGTEIYSVNLPHDEWLDFPSIHAAVEFIGRRSRAFTPINVNATALESRLGGES